MTAHDDARACTGSCLCATVRYRLRGPFGPMVHCHCSMCRKAHGSAFATFVGAASLEWESGRDDVVAYASSADNHRYFCRLCGSVTPAPEASGDQVFLPAGNVLEDCGARPVAHMFTDSRAPWIDIDDDLANYPEAPPGYEAPGAAATAGTSGSGAALTGGCLCGAVRYQISGEPLLMVNCHCSRCRRGRSAAHASNLFVLPEQLRWLAGEASVRVFDLPGAERFGIDFCETCGGNVPRPSPKIGRVNVPAGSLDGDPGVRPAFHIYVGSKAPWFEITDGLPCYAQGRPASSR